MSRNHAEKAPKVLPAQENGTGPLYHFRPGFLSRHVRSPESRRRYRELLATLDGSEPAAPAQAAPPIPAQPVTVAPSGPTMAEAMLRFSEHALSRFRDWENVQKPEFGNYRLIFRLLNEHFGDLPIEDFRGPQVKELQAAFVSAGWSRGYCNNQLRRLKRFIRWCVSDDLCSPDVLARIQTVEGLRLGEARETKKIRPVTDEVFRATLPHLRPVVADLLRIVALTGARPGEIRHLRIGQIDRTESVWSAPLDEHKNAHRNQQRILLFGPQAQAILSPYLNRDPDDASCGAAAAAKNKGTAESAESAKQKPEATAGKTLYEGRFESCRRAGLRNCFRMPKELRVISRKLPERERDRLRTLAAEWRALNCWTPNQLRHSRGTEIRKRYGIEHAQAVLGHASLSTSEIYAETDFARAREIMKEIG